VPSPYDMSHPVTHGEQREALAEFRVSLLAEIGPMIAREVAHAFKSLDESIRSHMNALLDKASADDAAVDARYSDLPPRVARLEAAVFPPRRPRRRRSA